jgi:hypothetical protein
VLSFWSRPPSARSSISSFIMFVAYNSRSSIHELFILRLKFMSFRSIYTGCGRLALGFRGPQLCHTVIVDYLYLYYS